MSTKKQRFNWVNFFFGRIWDSAVFYCIAYISNNYNNKFSFRSKENGIHWCFIFMLEHCAFNKICIAFPQRTYCGCLGRIWNSNFYANRRRRKLAVVLSMIDFEMIAILIYWLWITICDFEPFFESSSILLYLELNDFHNDFDFSLDIHV